MLNSMDVIIELRKASKDGKLLPAALQNIETWLGGGFLPEWASNAIGQLVKQEAWDELNDRFFQYMAFGTGGMRGRTIGKVTVPAETGELSAKGTWVVRGCIG